MQGAELEDSSESEKCGTSDTYVKKEQFKIGLKITHFVLTP